MTQRPLLLIVEDDEHLGRMLGTMLREAADVVHARDGRDALAWLAAHPSPSAILTDRMMPCLDGLGLVKALKGDPRYRSIPVMMLTAQGGARGTVEAINAGVKHYVSKPFKSAELLAKVRRMLAEAPPPLRKARSIDVDLSELSLSEIGVDAIDELEGIEEIDASLVELLDP
ncbi:MAG: response regulator [Sandaracinaceae bacterium]|nr:response regulator [Sandaracinaceae bacterium]